jgi:hypothetical protein
MAPFKRNHEVPKALIGNWRSTPARGEPVWVFDIRRQKIYQSTSVGSSAFKFAIIPNRYVVRLPRRRATDVEKWLGASEGAVARFIRGLELQISRHLAVLEAIPVAYGLIGLGFRSAYTLETWMKGLRDPQIQTRIGRVPKNEDDARKLVLENLINIVDRRVTRLLPPRFEILRGLGSNVLLSDQAALVTADDAGELYVPLAPRAVVCICRGVRPEVVITDASPLASRSLVENLNELIVQSARRWVVARTHDQLERVAPHLTSDAVGRRAVERERVAVEPLTERDRWWTLKD